MQQRNAQSRPGSMTSPLPVFKISTRNHTLTIVSLLFALMSDLCLPLSAGEDKFELHLV